MDLDLDPGKSSGSMRIRIHNTDYDKHKNCRILCNIQVTVRYSITPVGMGRELTGEVIEGGEGINAWHYVCRSAVHQLMLFSTGQQCGGF